MKIVSLIQGTPEWHAHRASHFNASDAPAMLGLSPYKTRAQLIRELATGAAEEIDAETQRRFDDGHLFEALARPVAEQIIGHELYPVVGSDGPYSASFDGLTLLGDMAFEHKSLNDALRAAMVEGCTGADLPELYQVQMEHQLMVSDEADRVLFMASKWKKDDQGEWELVEERHCWYVPNPDLRAKIVAGWAQLEADVAAFEPAAPAAQEATGRAPDQMPALRIEVTGMVTASNLAEWKDQAIAVFEGICCSARLMKSASRPGPRAWRWTSWSRSARTSAAPRSATRHAVRYRTTSAPSTRRWASTACRCRRR